MNPRGGTEILYGNLLRYVDKTLLNCINLHVSLINLQTADKPHILWQHLNTNEQAVQLLQDTEVERLISKHVFVSEWQRNKFITEFNIPPYKTIVIRNAIEDIDFVDKPKTSKLKLIYTSTPWRGLDLLLEAFKLLNRTDVELDVYSSTVIYGVNFMTNKFDWLFDKCRKTQGVNYRGYAANKAVRSAVQRSHIFAYPSVFEETSCLAAIEAGAAGCRIVTTDYGALSETCSSWARYVGHTADYKKLIFDFAQALNTEIEQYWDNYSSLSQQSKYFNSEYSWQTRKIQWNNFLQQYA